MAYNDLHVIVYRLLTYLYQQLKAGEPIDVNEISAGAFSIKESYWWYIFDELKRAGYTRGYTPVTKGDGCRIDHLDRTCITFKGIEYLTDDALMEKVRREEIG